MSHAISIDQLSRAEKLRMMEALWDDLSREEGLIESPPWHKEALEQTRLRRESGQERVVEWEQAKSELRRRAE